jgi:hypothetical protein
MLVERIDLLPMHQGTGRWNQTRYLLYGEVRFTNGQVRSFVTDQAGDGYSVSPVKEVAGVRRRRLAPLHLVSRLADNLQTSTTIEDDLWALGSLSTPDGTRRAILAELIDRASDLWLPRLEKWFEGLPG